MRETKILEGLGWKTGECHLIHLITRVKNEVLLIDVDLDTPAANVIFLPTTTHTALRPTQNGRIITPRHNKSTSICTK